MSQPDRSSLSERSNAAYEPRWNAELRRHVHDMLAHTILPFWQRSLDEKLGGVFNCWNNAGTQLLRRDKFTWSQGRFVWLWSRLAEATQRGLLSGDAAAYLQHAEKTVTFLENHAIQPDGRCVFLLSADGHPREIAPGSGLTPSIYADCFVIMGVAEFARVSGDRGRLDLAWQLWHSLEQRLTAGGYPLHPYPVPAGFRVYAVAMIRLNVLLVLERACRELSDTRAEPAWSHGVEAADGILDVFVAADGRVREAVPGTAAEADTLLARHLNPGHALEGLWMLLEVAQREQRGDWVQRAAEAVTCACRLGWDEGHGGLLHYIDQDGGEPRGRRDDSALGDAISASWDTKLWWVHSEALYATLLCHRVTGSGSARDWFERIFAYTWRTFPHADPQVGEWIQIRDRAGRPLEQVVALPVKDPYHIARNLLQILELPAP